MGQIELDDEERLTMLVDEIVRLWGRLSKRFTRASTG